MLSDYDKAWCNKLLLDLGKMPITSPFKMPVDTVHDAPNYLEFVEHPMDFSTMKKKLQNNEYPTVKSFIDDIQLICDNAKKFNGEQSLLGMISNDIMDEANKQYSEKASNADEEWYRSLSKAIFKLQEHINSAPPEVSLLATKTPMPDFQSLKLSDDKINTIQQMIGGESIDTLESRWMFLNENTRETIIKITESESND
ncbi:hypothetical protein M9Y10_004949 [Tritrichomonas musculus]|uniref:Bromo domain-containing protein n=1 Tax=Tritrichomonas musculus TaxID=1915356 RepID=A0ABR2JK49_9EUKA